MTPARLRWLAAWHGARLARKLDLDDLPDELQAFIRTWATQRLGAPVDRDGTGTGTNIAAYLALKARDAGPVMPSIRFIVAREWALTKMRRVPRHDERRAA